MTYIDCSKCLIAISHPRKKLSKLHYELISYRGHGKGEYIIYKVKNNLLATSNNLLTSSGKSFEFMFKEDLLESEGQGNRIK